MKMFGKKIGILAGLLVLIFVVGACGKKDELVKEETTTKATVAETTSVEETTETIRETLVGNAYERAGISDEDLEILIENNIYCYLFVFGKDTLATAQEVQYEQDPSKYLYQVEPTLYGDYAEFEAYIHALYAKEEAERLLFNYPAKNQAMYCNVDGKLCVDYRYRKLIEDSVDWFNYDFVVYDSTEEYCKFKIYTTKPKSETEEEDIEILGEAIVEDGYWVLKEMFH